MRGLILGVSAIALLVITAGLSYLFGVGPLAPPTAVRSAVFVAISRSLDPADARAIEVIDLASGNRDLFELGDGPITALALSGDRRSLYVGLASGRIVMLDATTGARFGAVDLGGPPIASLAASADGRTLLVFTVTNTESAIVPISIATKSAGDPIRLPPTAGAPFLRGNTLVFAFRDAAGLEVVSLDVATRAEGSRLNIPIKSLGPLAAFPIGAAEVGVVAFDLTAPSAMAVHLYVVTDPSHWRDALVPAPDPHGQFGFTPRGIGVGDAIHLCVDQGEHASRYVFNADLAPTLVDDDCGSFAVGDAIVMTTHDGSSLLVLDSRTGGTLRTLPLVGVAVRVAH